MTKRAARVGFDWPSTDQVLDKLVEEAREVVEARDTLTHDALTEEIGDLLFVAANLARHAKVDVGGALRRANLKFERRFRAMEGLAAAEWGGLAGLSLDEQDRYWERVKRNE